MKVLSIVMGIIYLILGILCFITPVFTANVFTYIIAAAILLAGIWMIVSYLVSQGEDSFIKKSGWSLAFGILTVILALILMFKPDFANVVMASIFGAWVIIAGIARIFEAFALKDIGSSWGFVLALGILTLILGIFLVCHPLITFVAIGIFIALSLLFEGINFIIMGCSL